MIFWVVVIVLLLLSIIRWNINTKELEVSKIRKEHRIHKGKVEYDDLGKQIKPLFSKKIKLVGKPDYVVEDHGKLIPIEIKSGSPKKPYKNHIMQLIAYCYLVEEKYNVKVDYGIIAYENMEVEIPYTEEDKQMLLATLNIMRTGKSFKRNHNTKGKCDICAFNYICKEKF